MHELVIASNNLNKISEITALLPRSIQLKSLEDIACRIDLPETQATLEGNALQKARYVFDNYGTNCFADDSGLEINSLNGRPGVYSARYAGESKNSQDNMNKVLLELGNTTERNACFRTIIALLWEGEEFLFEGRIDGVISLSKIGDGGFGYDPIFIPDGYSKTFAQMSSAEKNKISHRSKAVKKLISFFNSIAP